MRLYVHMSTGVIGGCRCTSRCLRHEIAGCIALSCSTLTLPTTPASLAAVCQLGPIHRCIVAWQLGPWSTNQGWMQQEFSPWHIKQRDWVVLQFNWFCFSVIHFKGRADVGPYSGASEPADASCVNWAHLGESFRSRLCHKHSHNLYEQIVKKQPCYVLKGDESKLQIPLLLFSPDGRETGRHAAFLFISVMHSCRGKARWRAKELFSIHLTLMVVNKNQRSLKFAHGDICVMIPLENLSLHLVNHS